MEGLEDGTSGVEVERLAPVACGRFGLFACTVRTEQEWRTGDKNKGVVVDVLKLTLLNELLTLTSVTAPHRQRRLMIAAFTAAPFELELGAPAPAE